jgi:hypothetical protein
MNSSGRAPGGVKDEACEKASLDKVAGQLKYSLT